MSADGLAGWPLGGLAVALGIGLLIGAERERSKGEGPARETAGVRTFALVALLGAVAAGLQSVALMIVLAAATALLVAAGYVRTRAQDPGLTTEIAVLLTFALTRAQLAAGLGVLVALLLASRSWLHELLRRRLSDRELLDGMLIAAAALIVLPLLPDRAVDPYGVVNPQVIWRLTVVVLLLNAFGYVAVRTLGATTGLAAAGLFGGFVSSAATIAAMGSRARSQPELVRAAAAGAALSSVATVVQLAIVLGIVQPRLLIPLGPALAATGGVAIAYGGLLVFAATRERHAADVLPGRAFQPRHAIGFALTVTGVLLVAALLEHHFGSGGALLGIGLAGLADAHSASASAAGLTVSGRLTADVALTAVALAVSTNTLTKAVVAWIAGGSGFARAVWPGLALMLAALWLALWMGAAAAAQ